MNYFVRSLIGLSTFALVACGGEDTPPTNPNPPPTGSETTGDNPFKRDTSPHSGTLYWSKPSNSGFAIWDVANSVYRWSVTSESVVERQISLPHMALESTTVAAVVSTPYNALATMPKVHVYTTGNTAAEVYPDDGLTSDQIRLSSAPTLSANGNTVAVIAKTVTFGKDPSIPYDIVVEETKWGIEVWDRTSQTRRTFGSNDDRWPMVNYDGTAVTFLSYRDGTAGDFYRQFLDEPERLHRYNVGSHPELKSIFTEHVIPQMSGHGAWIVFTGTLHTGGTAAFLLDGTTGDVQRISGDATTIGSVAISGDGSTIAWSGNKPEVEASDDGVRIKNRGVVVRRTDVSTPLVVVEDAALFGPIALNADGSTVVYMSNDIDSSVTAMNPDGSNRRVVTTGKDEKNVLSLGPFTMRFR